MPTAADLIYALRGSGQTSLLAAWQSTVPPNMQLDASWNVLISQLEAAARNRTTAVIPVSQLPTSSTIKYSSTTSTVFPLLLLGILAMTARQL